MSPKWQLSLSKTKGLLSYQHPVTFSNFDISQFLIMSLEESSGRIWTRDLEAMSLLGRPLEPTIFINKNLCRPVQSKNWGQFSEDQWSRKKTWNKKQLCANKMWFVCFCAKWFWGIYRSGADQGQREFYPLPKLHQKRRKKRTTIWICYSNFELFW